MAYGTLKRTYGPAALASAVANIYQGGGGSALIYDKIECIHVVNKTGAQATTTQYIGATGGSAAGTELFVAQPVSANGYWDWFNLLKLLSTDFLTGLASAATTLTITIMGEQFVV
jgi:hypothetical protein